MPFAYGVPFTYTFYPLLNDQPLTLPAQTATLYVFDGEPTREAARAGTGALQTQTTTLATAASNIGFSISAIEDPDPDGEEVDQDYWVAIKYVLVAAGQVQLSIRKLEMERVKAQHSTLSIGASDLEAVWKHVSSYADGTQINTRVATCRDQLKAELRDRGYEWASIFRPDRLKDVLVHLVLASIAFGEFNDGGESFRDIAIEFKTTAKRLLDSLKLEIGEKEPPAKDDVKPLFNGVVLFSK